MADDLFAAAAEERLSGRSPLAARLRPRNLGDVVGQRHLLAPGRPLRALIEGVTGVGAASQMLPNSHPSLSHMIQKFAFSSSPSDSRFTGV